MALTESELQAVTDEYIISNMPEDIFFRTNVLLFKLRPSGTAFSGGDKLKAFLEYGMQPAGSYGARTTLPSNKKEIFTHAKFEYAAYFATMTYDMTDNLQNSGPQALVNIISGKLKNGGKSIREAMSVDIYRSYAANLAAAEYDDPWPFYGVADLFNQSDTFAYGEILPTDLVKASTGLSMWKAGYVSTAAAISFAALQELRRAASIDTNNEGKPDLYITTEVLKDAFENSLQQQARYTSQNLAEAGFDNVLFKGNPLVADDKQAAGQVDAYNTRYLELMHHSERNFTKPVWEKVSPNTPETFVANTRWVGQLVCKNRSAHARRVGLTAA